MPPHAPESVQSLSRAKTAKRWRVAHSALLMSTALLFGSNFAVAETSRQSVSAEVERQLVEADRIFNTGQYAEALILIDQAWRTARAELGPSAPESLHAQNDHAGTLYHLGRLHEAQAEFEDLLQVFRKQGNESDPVALDALNNYANVLGAQGQLAIALPLYRRAYELRKAATGDMNVDTISALGDLAWALGATGELKESLQLSEEVLRLRQQAQGPRHEWTFTAMNNLAHTYQLMGRDAQALSLHEQALQLRLEELGEQHPETMVSINNVGTALERVGRLAEALAMHRRAWQLQSKKLGPSHLDALNSLTGVGNDLMSMGRPDAAERVFRKVLSLRLTGQAPQHQRTSMTRVSLAQALLAQGRVAEALAQTEQAVQALTASAGLQNYQTLSARIWHAKALAASGRQPEAIKQLESASQDALAVNGPSWPLTLGARKDLAKVALDHGELDRVVTTLTPTLSEIERLQAALPHADSQAHQALLKDFRGAYRLQAEALARSGRVAEAFAVLETGKARQLLNQLDEASAAKAAGLSAEEWAQLRQAGERVVGLTSVLANTTDLAVRAPLLQARQDAIAAADNMAEAMRRQHPGFAQVSHVSAADWHTAGRLPARSTLLSYAVGPEDSVSAFVASGARHLGWQPLGKMPGLADTVAAFRLWTANLGLAAAQDDLGQPVTILRWMADGQPRWKVWVGSLDCREQVDAWLDAPSSAGSAGTQALPGPCPPPAAIAVWGTAAYSALARHLGDRLLAPLRKDLAGSMAIVVSPDGPLGAMPWDALRVGNEPWGSRNQVSLVHSLSTFVAGDPLAAPVTPLDGQPAPRLGLLAIGNPAFEPSSVEGASTRGARSTQRLRVLRQERLPGTTVLADGRVTLQASPWSALPATQVEMDRSARAFGSSNSQVVSGLRATESAVRQLSSDGSLARADHVLLATHAFFDAARPALSSIVLRREGDLPENDGYLTAAELAGLRLDSRLVVLSACNTALNDANDQDAQGGFAYALRLAGNRDALMTLWPVDDELSALFISRFMGHVAAGQDTADALARTKWEFSHAASKRLRSPALWAAYVLYPGRR